MRSRSLLKLTTNRFVQVAMKITHFIDFYLMDKSSYSTQLGRWGRIGRGTTEACPCDPGYTITKPKLSEMDVMDLTWNDPH